MVEGCNDMIVGCGSEREQVDTLMQASTGLWNYVQ